jgi:hypothetical protein
LVIDSEERENSGSTVTLSTFLNKMDKKGITMDNETNEKRE